MKTETHVAEDVVQIRFVPAAEVNVLPTMETFNAVQVCWVSTELLCFVQSS